MEEKLEAIALCGGKEIAVFQSGASHLVGGDDVVGNENLPERNGCSLVEKDFHRPGAGSRLDAVNSITLSTCSRVTPGNHSMVAPSSRFSKRVFTGTRVPRKSQAPLTFPANLSTTGHSDQSMFKA